MAETVDISGRRVLLVDDNADVAEIMGMALTAMGAEVTCAFSGEQALERCADSDFDAVVLDLGLPDLPGTEVGRRLAQQSRRPVLVALTGFEAGEEAGVFDVFLQKPVGAPELAGCIAGALSRRGARNGER